MVIAATIAFAVLFVGWLVAPSTQPERPVMELDLGPAEVPSAA